MYLSSLEGGASFSLSWLTFDRDPNEIRKRDF